METMTAAGPADRWAFFESLRGRLYHIALRIVGSADDAEDLVQEASVRWLGADPAAVRAPEGWLVTVVTRLAIDSLRRSARERQAYGNAWQVLPAGATDWTTPDRAVELASHMSKALRVLRERLEPAERTAFVLREAFASEYGEIARVLGKSEGACRQIVHRARERVRQDGPRLARRRDPSGMLTEQFLAAMAAGDREAVLAVLAAPLAERPLVTQKAAPEPTRRPDGAPARGRPRSLPGRISWKDGGAKVSTAA